MSGSKEDAGSDLIDRDVIQVGPGQLARLIPGEDAERLADLTGIQRDLGLVAEACRVISARREAPAAATVRRACFDSAVMRYRRCFRNAVRALLRETLLSELTTDERALHERVLQLADRSVAHCVDGSEENTTYVLAGPMVERKVPLEINVVTRTVSHHNVVDPDEFEALAERVRQLARSEADELAKAILKRLEMMKTDEILALEEPVSYIKDGKAGQIKYGSRRRKAKARD